MDYNGLEQFILGKVRHALQATARTYFKQIEHQFTGQYSLAQLKALDHPYAKRHGDRGGSIPNDPWWMINTQSGNLAKGLSFDGNRNGSIAAKVKFDMGVTDYAPHVFDGTKIMIGRNVFKIELQTHLEWYSKVFGAAVRN